LKILVTGGAGFIGSCFIRHMLEKYANYQIVNLDKLTYAGNLENLEDVKHHPGYKFIQGDICNSSSIFEIMHGIDCCINFAAESHVDRSIQCSEEFIKTNITGTHTLLCMAKELNIGRFIQISTDEVYGSLGQTGYFTEKSPLAPNNPYAASKASADLLVRSFFKTYGLPVIITRCSNNYGPYQYPEKLIPLFITNILNNKPVPVYGDGQGIRDWLYVYDHCSAIDAVLHNGKEGEIYNIAGQNEKTNLEITEIILKAFNKNASFLQHVEDRPGHDRRYALDISKIKNELGWQPSMPFDAGIKQTIDWYIHNKTWVNSIKVKQSLQPV
jgi:dTDP-glucose 4,6-dehydratase